jgi:hypothetical protein
MPASPVNIATLQLLMQRHRNWLPAGDWHKSITLIHELQHGVDSLQSIVLPGATVPNSGSVLLHGEEFTDTVAHWVNKGFIRPLWHPPNHTVQDKFHDSSSGEG